MAIKQNAAAYNNCERYIIPSELMFEIAQVILQVDFVYEIIGVKENRRAIVLCIEYDAKSKLHQQAIDNIEEILQAYHEICYDKDERVNWREY